MALSRCLTPEAWPRRRFALPDTQVVFGKHVWGPQASAKRSKRAVMRVPHLMRGEICVTLERTQTDQARVMLKRVEMQGAPLVVCSVTVNGSKREGEFSLDPGRCVEPTSVWTIDVEEATTVVIGMETL
jgi:hypothetical protein